MNNHTFDIATVIVAWVASAVFTMFVSTASLITIPKPEIVLPVKDGTTQSTAGATQNTVKDEVKQIEQKLAVAENDLTEIAKLIEEKIALQKAEKLDKDETKTKGRK